jgi:lipopolysaccharide export LptBFGC system permease protein LptF
VVAIVAAATLVFGRLSSDNEIIAIKVAGISIVHTLSPLFLLGLIVGAGLFLLYNSLLPTVVSKRKVFIRQALFERLRTPPPGKTHLKLVNYSLSYESCKGGIFKNPLLLHFDKDGKLRRLYQASSGKAILEGETPSLLLQDCIMTIFSDKGIESEGYTEDSVKVSLLVRELKRGKKSIPEMNQAELLRFAEHPLTPPDKRSEALTDLHKRIARPVALPFLIMAVLPLGLSIRKSSKIVGLGVSLLLVLFYFVIATGSEGAGAGGICSPLIAAYLPVALIFLVSTILYIILWKT